MFIELTKKLRIVGEADAMGCIKILLEFRIETDGSFIFERAYSPYHPNLKLELINPLNEWKKVVPETLDGKPVVTKISIPGRIKIL